ncbi:yfeABCD regulator yfeE [Klebsiella pneumoniae]|nr:yfeABCD regulator yfeE [Klebsiella pneumoniae]
MTYQQAGRIAVIKRILGWVIFIPAVLSTLISVLKFMYEHSEKKPGIDAVMMDFAHVMIEMMRFNTPFLNFFWYNSPLPDFHHSLNIGFWIILHSGVRRHGPAGFRRANGAAGEISPRGD